MTEQGNIPTTPDKHFIFVNEPHFNYFVFQRTIVLLQYINNYTSILYRKIYKFNILNLRHGTFW